MKWMSEVKCDIHGPTCKMTPFFVDGKTTRGPWALMCPAAFREFGIGLGTGKGQKYDAKTLEKIDG